MVLNSIDAIPQIDEQEVQNIVLIVAAWILGDSLSKTGDNDDPPQIRRITGR